jgi:hypothetical protein
VNCVTGCKMVSLKDLDEQVVYDIMLLPRTCSVPYC